MRNRSPRPQAATWRLISEDTGRAWPAESVAVCSKDDGGPDIGSVTCDDADFECGERVIVRYNGTPFFTGTVVDLSIPDEVGIEGHLQFGSQEPTTALPFLTWARN